MLILSLGFPTPIRGDEGKEELCSTSASISGQLYLARDQVLAKTQLSVLLLIVGCKDLGPIEHGRHNLMSDDSENSESHIWLPGTQITYSCQDDMVLKGSKTHVCTKDGWSPGIKPTCKRGRIFVADPLVEQIVTHWPSARRFVFSPTLQFVVNYISTSS